MKLLRDIGADALLAYAGPAGPAQFLQSREWGEFQAAAGNRILRFGFADDSGEVLAAFSGIVKPLPLGAAYLYLPRIRLDRLAAADRLAVIQGFRELARSEACLFVRFEPRAAPDLPSGVRLVKTIPVQPQETLILDISRTEEAILAGMHPKTRYNIGLAHKKGVNVREAGAGDLDVFQKLLDETTARDGFRSHGSGYYRSMLTVPFITLLVAEYDGEVIAGNIVSFYGNTATYIHGASGNDQRNVMAPYSLQWMTIGMAKAKGLEYYDLHGIDENKWPGVTRFKLGFGGERIRYPGAYDLVVDRPRYEVYRRIRTIRRLIGKIGR